MNKAATKTIVLTILLVLLIAVEGFCQSVSKNQNQKKALFLPIPKQIEYMDGSLSADTSGKLIFLDCKIDDAILSIADNLQESLEMLGCKWQFTAMEFRKDNRTGLSLSIDPVKMPKTQGYQLKINDTKISIIAHDKAGAFYAAQTLRQLCMQYSESKKLPCVEINDWPDFPNRGVMMDISRDKVPTMNTLYELVDMLAGLKINQLQLYTEHTFAYRNHRTVWQNASPMTGEEILLLDRYCRQRFIELVPNQNSFSHLARWLGHEPYQKLAESTKDTVLPKGKVRRFYALCPTDPNSIKFLDELYSELLPHFTSDSFNVGCDEVRELPYGRSKDLCNKIGEGRVYLDFLLKIHKLCQKNGKTMQFWADIILKYPELIPELPKDVVALVWGYEANSPFNGQCEQFSKNNIPLYVCPGTSSWSSLAGRTNAAIGNMANAAQNGLKYKAEGFLVTDWGSYGHWQPLSVSFIPIACAAAVSWSFEQNKDINLPDVTSLFIFKDPTGSIGHGYFDLGNVTPDVIYNGNVPFLMLVTPDFNESKRPYNRMTMEQLQQEVRQIDKICEAVKKAKTCDNNKLMIDEFYFAAKFLRHACQLGIVRLQHNDNYENLSDDIQQIMAEHKRIWLQRNRPGGLNDSLGLIQTVSEFYQQNKQKHF